MIIKTILFDADGVVIKAPCFGKSLEDKYGISPNVTETFYKNIFEKCLVGKADTKVELVKFLHHWGWKKSVDEYMREWFVSEHVINQPLVSLITLLQARGIACYLATNQEKYRTEYITYDMGFGDIFDGIFSSAHIGYKKTDRQFFEYIINSLNGMEKHTVLLWDDSPKNIIAAERFGLHAELFKDLDDFKKKLKKFYSLSL